jgi:broad specificity phosphatase PhoE
VKDKFNFMLDNKKKRMVLKKVIDEKKQPVIVYLVRHGATAFNSPDHKSDKIRGWIDVPLDEAGKKEAERLGKFFKDKNIASIWYSDLKRTNQTAHIMNKYTHSKCYSTSQLRPWNLGELQGQPSEVVHPDIVKYIKNPTTSPKGGESFDSFKTRYLNRLREFLDQAKKTGKNIALVEHYRNLKLARAWYDAGMKDDKFDYNAMVDGQLETGAVLKFTYNGKRWTAQHIKIN